MTILDSKTSQINKVSEKVFEILLEEKRMLKLTDSLYLFIEDTDHYSIFMV